jgi:alpha-ribazole phosphatase
MKVHFLRHTKPDIEAGICYGQSDIGLSKSFPDEQLSIKERLGSISFDCIISSPLKRCVDLAQFLCPVNIEISIDDRLMEMNFGTWEMMNWQKISKSKEAQNWFNDYVNVRCPDGESFMDLYNRVKDFLTTLKKQNQFKQPLIVTHAGVIRSAYCFFGNTDLKESFNLNIGFGELKTFEL